MARSPTRSSATSSTRSTCASAGSSRPGLAASGRLLDRPRRAAYNPLVFGISFAKLIVLVVVFAAAWYGIRYLQMRSEAPRRSVRRDAPEPPPAAGPRPGGAPAATEDLVKCPVCATYVTRGARSCG